MKWSEKVGEGVATPALAGGKLYTFTWDKGREVEVTQCLDADTGKQVWKDEYKTTAADRAASSFPAARSSPAVAGGRVYTFGVRGVLSCLDAANGKEVWRQKDTGTVPGFYTSCSPVLFGGLLIIQVGGDRGGGGAVVALDPATGDEKWRYKADGTKFASPAPIEVGGLKAVAVTTAGSVSVIGLDGGKQLWSAPFSANYNASSPVVVGTTLIYSGESQPTRAVALTREGDKLAGKELWANRDNPVKFNTPAVRDGRLYGISQNNELFCIDVRTGKTLWSGRLGTGGGGGGKKGKGGGSGGYGSVVAAGPVLFALTPAGQLSVIEPKGDEYKELARYPVAKEGTFAYPVVTGNRVYIKDRDAVTLWVIE
jgi:outer membrane protein assembly factor BamB